MSPTRLILREDVARLGHAGDLVSVKPGYARNYLIPQGKAIVATESRIKEIDHHKRIITDKQAKQLKGFEAVQRRLQSTEIEVTAQAGEGGKLFGSVTLQQIADLLKEKGLEVDRRKMHTDEPIKTIGEHVVEVRLHREFTAQLKVKVKAENEEPAQAEPEQTDAEDTESAETVETEETEETEEIAEQD
jgi:large subunit ribosomal protein L9